MGKEKQSKAELQCLDATYLLELQLMKTFLSAQKRPTQALTEIKYLDRAREKVNQQINVIDKKQANQE